MAKCPICGSDYYSSEDRCFACAEKTLSPAVGRRVEQKLRNRRLAGISSGIFIFLLGIAEILSSASRPEQELGIGSHLLANMFVVVSGIGAFVAAFSQFGTVVPMWLIHDGHEPDCRRAGGFTSAGIAFVVVIVGAAAVANHFDGLSEYGIVASGLSLELSCVMIAMGILRRPPGLFREDERAYIPARERYITGAWMIGGGLLTLILLGLFGAPLLGVLYSLVLIISGVVVATAAGFRPWLSTGFEKI